MLFATWLSEIGDLRGQLTSLNSYVQAAKSKHLPSLTAVDEAVTEPTADAARTYIQGLKQPLSLSGRPGHDRPPRGRLRRAGSAVVRAGLIIPGKIVWSHDGWLSPSDLEAAVAKHS